MRNSIFVVSSLVILLILAGCGKSSSKGAIKIMDVTKAQSISISVSRPSVSGLTIHCRGEIDGKATLSASNWASEPLSGKVDWQVYHDWFTNACTLKYNPSNVTTGHLEIDYEFH